MRLNLIIVLNLLCANIIAQGRFHSTYSSIGRNDFGDKILELNHNELLVLGVTTFNGRPMKFLKIDSTGNQIYQNHYLNGYDLFGGGRFRDSVMYCYGDLYNPIEGAADSHIFYFSENGDSIKTQIYNLAFNDRIHDLHLKPDSTFIAYGFYTDTIPAERTPYVANIDTVGDVLWFKTHSKLNHDAEIKNLQATSDGGYVFSGTEVETLGGHTDLFLTKVDIVGDLVWKQYYNEPLSQKNGHVEVLRDGNYALFGTGYHPLAAQRAILKIDQAGNLIWRRKHGINNLDEGYNVGKELPNGNFICAGSSIRMYNGLQVDDINLSMLDSAGNLLWSRDYNYHGLDINQYVRDLIVTSDGGFAMTGFILNAPGGTGNDVFVLKTDTNGLITSLNSGFREVTPDMRVYPNPTKDFVNVPYVEGLERIELYDVGGKLLQNFVILSDSRSVNKIDLSNYTNGIYILKLYMKNGEIYSKKVIKE
jgi:hypothetical protein